MRVLLGIILGFMLTVGGAYLADTAAAGPRPIVNWDVVSKGLDGLTGVARDSWKKIAG